tara:strand:- start:3316 stop:3957 length:642 start_codon:yes stop_codon:yes gene_type:complete
MENYLYQTSPTANPSKGTEIMDGLLLLQYQNKPNLREYMLAFVDEMDLLLENLEKVYSGRFINDAVGAQLDVIGIILDQLRNVELDKTWFGFQNAVDVNKMADEAIPDDGGYFRGEELDGFVTFPLDDITYRRLLLAKAQLLCRDSVDINTAYYVISIILGKVPETMTIELINPRHMQLEVSASDVAAIDLALVNYLGQYFVPMGTTFSTVRV